MKKIKTLAVTGATALLLSVGMSAMAYDGTKCQEAGKCWEAKPGFPEKSKGLNMIQNIAKLNWINKTVQWKQWKLVTLNA